MPLEDGWVKLNTDGCSKGTLELARGDEIICNILNIGSDKSVRLIGPSIDGLSDPILLLKPFDN